ncbi:hypothetical protein [Halobacillus sp. A5]|uniref:hypothetical protein n=1 Tax=Halobacillus sp. A5 TaxID=2880263 RepID=UPI0020A6A800|nr:hypothetical protein [Halobacillus sp. A5]MCP3026601.1 hypothetical protein [Halobacillus sp. A5]
METRKKVFSRNQGQNDVRQSQAQGDRETGGEESASLSEAFIFKLSKHLGGREEVVRGKAVELLKFMDMELQQEETESEKEQHRMWLNYLSMIYSQRPEGKEPPRLQKAREDFHNVIKPKDKVKPSEQYGPAKVYDWDFERLKRIQQQQKGG